MPNRADAARVASPSADGVVSERAAAFAELADNHLAAAYRLARAILLDPVAAEDVTHDAFITAWRHWGQLRDPSRFEPWFDRILVNTCRNHLRRHRTVSFVRDVSPELRVDPAEPIVAALDRDVIGAAMARLAPDQRVVIALRFFRDLTVEDIAGRLGIPVGTAKSRLHYGLRALRATIARSEGEVVR